MNHLFRLGPTPRKISQRALEFYIESWHFLAEDLQPKTAFSARRGGWSTIALLFSDVLVDIARTCGQRPFKVLIHRPTAQDQSTLGGVQSQNVCCPRMHNSLDLRLV